MPNNKKLTPQQEQAKSLYFQDGLTQAQIAEKVGTSQKTVSLWINEGKWNLLKNISEQTPVVLIIQMTNELTEINNAIAAREPGKRFPTLQEAEVRRKIMASINILKTQQSAGANIEVLMNFLYFVTKENIEHAKLIIEYAEEYLKGEKMTLETYGKFTPYPLPSLESSVI